MKVIYVKIPPLGHEKTKPIYGHWLEVYGQIVLLGFERAINL
jgi:hypothetical protein